MSDSLSTGTLIEKWSCGYELHAFPSLCRVVSSTGETRKEVTEASRSGPVSPLTRIMGEDGKWRHETPYETCRKWLIRRGCRLVG